jgi:protease-4
VIIAVVVIGAIAVGLICFSDAEFDSGTVAVIPVKGAITGDPVRGFLGSGSTSTSIVERIEEANKDPKIKAVIFEINSPGGSAVASEEIVTAVKRLDKPSVAWIREIGTSGAYWIASATDHVVASRMSLTGSIGVLGSYLEIAELLDRYNVTYRRLVGGEYKDMGAPFKKLTPQEERLFQQKIDKLHDYFVEDVAENRNLNRMQIEEVRSGLFFLGTEALELGLIDEIGGKQEAIDYVEKELNITAKLKYYKEKKSLFELLSQLNNNPGLWGVVQRGISIQT